MRSFSRARGDDLLVGEVAGGLADQLLLVGEFEVHGGGRYPSVRERSSAGAHLLAHAASPRTKSSPTCFKRSPRKVQRTSRPKTLDVAALEQSLDSDRGGAALAPRYAAVKHIAEKRGDHWELKDEAGRRRIPRPRPERPAARERPRRRPSAA